MNTPRPSERARELLKGAYDTHMHISPDVVERKIFPAGGNMRREGKCVRLCIKL